MSQRNLGVSPKTSLAAVEFSLPLCWFFLLLSGQVHYSRISPAESPASADPQRSTRHERVRESVRDRVRGKCHWSTSLLIKTTHLTFWTTQCDCVCEPKSAKHMLVVFCFVRHSLAPFLAQRNLDLWAFAAGGNGTVPEETP